MWLAPRRRPAADRPDLCPLCGSDFVHPVRWHEASKTHLRVLLRCGQCDTWREAMFTDEELDRYDEKLDEATKQIAEEADRLHRAWRSTEADAFAAALDRNLIDAGDFAS